MLLASKNRHLISFSAGPSEVAAKEMRRLLLETSMLKTCICVCVCMRVSVILYVCVTFKRGSFEFSREPVKVTQIPLLNMR